MLVGSGRLGGRGCRLPDDGAWGRASSENMESSKAFCDVCDVWPADEGIRYSSSLWGQASGCGCCGCGRQPSMSHEAVMGWSMASPSWRWGWSRPGEMVGVCSCSALRQPCCCRISASRLRIGSALDHCGGCSAVPSSRPSLAVRGLICAFKVAGSAAGTGLGQVALAHVSGSSAECSHGCGSP